MEQKKNLPDMIYDTFKIKPLETGQYSPLSLAYIGDSIFDMIIRTLLVSKSNAPVKKLHKKASEIVNAKSQARLITLIKPELSEEEIRILKRGRNAKSGTTAKNATFLDYRKATGLETLIGFLYLTGRLERAVQLTESGLKRMEILPWIIN
ncbi:MAG: ribonuclease III [Lachnoclostridium sp.]|jgi:ribonuclease-3 family protein|nr:ribonuclease III [Lachnoclostridium sp.]